LSSGDIALAPTANANTIAANNANFFMIIKVLKVIQCANIQRYFQTITCNQKQFHVWDSFQRKKFNQHGYPCGYNQREQLDVVHHAMHHDTFRLHFSALESAFCRF
jgi:hypothetical protein